jgi:hypothetical protein
MMESLLKYCDSKILAQSQSFGRCMCFIPWSATSDRSVRTRCATLDPEITGRHDTGTVPWGLRTLYVLMKNVKPPTGPDHALPTSSCSPCFEYSVLVSML